ncbi:MAG: FadR/GntR family transcriptional regulator [Eubacteriales bacterium]
MDRGKNMFKNVRQGSLAKIVMEQIKEAMIKKKLRPGDRLPTETELCESLGVGKSSVREAIKMLEVLGVVQTRQGDGTYIATGIREDSVNPLLYQLLIECGNKGDILELRTQFEPMYSLLALEKATNDDVEKIKTVHLEFCEKVKAGIQTADDDLSFHIAILNATHNPFIIRIGMTVLQLFRESIEMSMEQIPQKAVLDHTRIYQAFTKKDREELYLAIVDSFEAWSSLIDEY